ncbi:hypothetical protein ORI94_15920 [Streptomyces sp. NEAU-W12]|nr:hypothetical protein [Streptomyces sp. NEAU-W12]MCX2925035.1 hypothetical protein [Streptomyces sp. NEAU-W12]
MRSLCRAEEIPLVGGGGTDPRTGFATALRSRPRPDALAVLTDGRTPGPDRRPSCRTVVCLFPRRPADASSYDEDNPEHRPDAPPGWARVVTVAGAPGRR